METGLLMLPGALVSGLLMPVIGKLYDRTGPRPLAVFGILSLTVTTYMLHGIELDTSYRTIAWLMVLRGVSMSFAAVSAQAATMDSVTNEEAGDASTISNIVSRVSGALGLAALTSVLTGRVAHYAQELAGTLASADGDAAAQAAQIQAVAFVRGLDEIFLIASLLTLAGLISALFLKKERKSPQG